MNTKDKIINFIKKEVVLSVAIVLTIVTCFFVQIDKEYLYSNVKKSVRLKACHRKDTD